MSWSKDYKKSIDCGNPKGFSQKAHCAARKKRQQGEETKSRSIFNEESATSLNYDWNTPIRERSDRYCPKCEKLELRSECKYGPKYWEMYSLPAELVDNKKDYKITMPYPGPSTIPSQPVLTYNQVKYNTNRPHPANESKDHEYSMARSELSTIVKAAKRLQKKMKKGEGEIEAWVQSKITKAADYIDTAADYVDSGEMNKEEVEISEGKRDGKSAKDKDYSLRDWFKGGGWVQAGGKYDGKPCAKQPGQKTKPFCRDADDRAAMSKEERNRRAAKKRKEDPNPNRKGEAKFVTAEQVDATKRGGPEKLLQDIIDKDKKGPNKYGGGEVIRTGLQKAHFEPEGQLVSEGKPYKVGDQIPQSATKPAPKPSKFKVDTTGLKGPEKPLGEEKDACYKKVKARYDVWPSAYASGALVKCRKVGAANWGNKTQKEGYEFSNWRDDFKALEIETFDIIKPEPLVNEGLGKVAIAAGALALPYLMKKLGEKPVNKALDKGREELHLNNKPFGAGARGLDRQSFEPNGEIIAEKEDPCWDGYKQVGMKKKGGKMVPNCVKEEYSNWREELNEDWQKVNRQDKTDGLSQKAVDAYRRENPGSKLQTAVTEKKPKGKRAKRRANFCRRMKGMKSKLTSAETARDPDSRINKALRRWNCN